MFNEHHTRAVVGEPGSFYCTSQLALGTARKIDQLVWLSEHADDFTDLSYKGILDSLEKGKRENPKLQFIRSLESDFINTIVPTKIKTFEERRKVVANPNALFLDCHPKVPQTGKTLSTVAVEEGFDAMLCNEPSQMEDALYKVSILTFVFGDPAIDWFWRHFEIVWKHRNRKIRHLSVFSDEKCKGFSKELG